jgi:hypothetical protein
MLMIMGVIGILTDLLKNIQRPLSYSFNFISLSHLNLCYDTRRQTSTAFETFAGKIPNRF